MRLKNLVTNGGAVLAFLACASASGSAGAGTGTPSAAGVPTWSGSLQPTQQRTGGLAVTGQSKAHGNVSITPAAGQLQRMHVVLTVTLPTNNAATYRWAVLPGRCGTGPLPLIGFEQFPVIDVGANGRGQIEIELPLELAAESSYHVNVYRGGQQLDNVVTCANLRYEASAR